MNIYSVVERLVLVNSPNYGIDGHRLKLISMIPTSVVIGVR